MVFLFCFVFVLRFSTPRSVLGAMLRRLEKENNVFFIVFIYSCGLKKLFIYTYFKDWIGVSVF